MFSSLRSKSLIVNQIAVMLILVALVGIGFIALNAMKQSADQMGLGKDVVADILPPPLYLIEAQLVGYDLIQAEASARQPLIDKLQTLKKDYDSRNQFWESSLLDKDVKSSLMGDQRKHADLFWKVTLEHFIPAIQANDMDAARAAAQTMRSHYEYHRKGVDATVGLANKYASDKLNDLTKTATQGYWKLGVAAGLGMLLVLVLAVPTINRIYRNLSVARDAASAIAAGDLTRPIPAAGNDEVGALLVKLGIMRDNLLTLIGAVRQNVNAVMQSASELSASASVSAKASESQSEAASSMAAAMEELSVSIDQVGEHAHEARDVTLISGQQSEEGGRIIHTAADEMRLIAVAVNSTADTLRELEGYSGQISSIVNVIKDIADQTNLLALNAAIEAARAGEQGRGFAVVADEVRKLAERTANSTQEITSMIFRIQQGTQRAVQEMEAGVRRVNDGVELANQAGNSVTGIRDGSEKVTHAVDEITFALKEQVAASREIARRVEQIAQGAEKNSVTVAQTAESAHQMEALAAKLNSLAGKFRIG